MKCLHTMLRVSDLEQSIDFYTKVLTFKGLDKSINEAYRYTLVFVGYESKGKGASIELTFNWDTNEYELGNAFGHIELGVED